MVAEEEAKLNPAKIIMDAKSSLEREIMKLVFEFEEDFKGTKVHEVCIVRNITNAYVIGRREPVETSHLIGVYITLNL